MTILYTAIKDPEFKGTWGRYNLVSSKGINEHLRDIKEVIMKYKPQDKYKVIFYSVPDALGMRFMRLSENTDTGEWWILSDFRYEWK